MTDKPIWFDELEQLRNDVKQLKAENTRLREALKKIRDSDPEWAGDVAQQALDGK